MEKFIKCFFIMFFCNFIFISKVSAECSYDERRDLLNKAKNIDAYFEPDLNNNSFVFYLYNLDNDLYVNLENLSNNQFVSIYKYQFDTEFYTMVENNVDDIINYKLNIYSNKSECYGNILTIKNIRKGIINKFYNEEICKGIEDYKYCVPVLNNKFNIDEEEIRERISDYKDSLLVEEEVIIEDKFGIDDLKNLIMIYWFIPIILIVLIVFIFVIRYVNKKRGEL